MLERTLRVLEFNKIKDMMKPLALSEPARELIDKLTPSSDLATVQLWQQETEEASVILTYIGSHPMTAFEDVRQYLRLAEIGSALSMKALLAIAAFMRAGRVARSALATDRENTPYINSLAGGLNSFRQLEEDIEAAIISEDEMSDRASPELYDLRRRIRTANDRIRDKLNSYIHNPNTQKYLQDYIITVRNGRYVLPVKAECRASVPGLIHDQSATGATLFIEPMAIVEINNDLKELMGKERQEIERILMAFTQQIAPECDSLRSNLDILAQLDFAFAKALLSRNMTRYLRVAQRQRLPAYNPRPASAAGPRQGRAAGHMAGRGVHDAGHNRPQYRRQDRHAQDGGPVYADGAGGASGAGGAGHGAGRVRQRVRRHRRRAVH